MTAKTEKAVSAVLGQLKQELQLIDQAIEHLEGIKKLQKQAEAR